ncbi:hypothetical protein FRAHR75_870013 [Frankia sp. Hr75.2]|nr:hypothetical protein FRAHR75_870013 [Frankia sp. Hr75.2]
MPEQDGEPRPAARAAALDRPDRYVQQFGHLGDRAALDVHEDDRGAQCDRKHAERGADVHPGVVLGDGVPGVGRLVGGAVGGRGHRHRRAHGAAAQPVEGGVGDDPVQPGADSRLTPEVGGPPVRGEHRLLDGVRRLLGVLQQRERHRPQPVGVRAEQLAERRRVTRHVPAQRREVGLGSPAGGSGTGRRGRVHRLPGTGGRRPGPARIDLDPPHMIPSGQPRNSISAIDPFKDGSSVNHNTQYR